MIHSLRLQNFRSYADESFEFEPGVNIIVGPNGSGKTNLLEAILAIATGSSYRAGDAELIQFEKSWARLDAGTHTAPRTVKLNGESGRVIKSYVFDDKPYKLLTLNHRMPVVLFEPNHLQLLSSQPELRRAYMDNLLEQTIPGFSATRQHYRRVLAQRNALLKSVRGPTSNIEEKLFVWNLRLSELGGAIAVERSELIADMQKTFPRLYSNLAGSKKTKVALAYKSKLPINGYESALLKALENSFDQDVARGFTTQGPHRDDFMVLFDGRPAAEVASRGETRTALLALKVYELELLEQKRGQKPLLLLDDVFSELDGKRRHALARFISSHQTFITTTDADFVLAKQMQPSHVIPVTKVT
jgi:DNA replication and repair protein RecF